MARGTWRTVEEERNGLQAWVWLPWFDVMWLCGTGTRISVCNAARVKVQWSQISVSVKQHQCLSLSLWVTVIQGSLTLTHTHSLTTRHTHTRAHNTHTQVPDGSVREQLFCSDTQHTLHVTSDAQQLLTQKLMGHNDTQIRHLPHQTLTHSSRHFTLSLYIY